MRVAPEVGVEISWNKAWTGALAAASEASGTRSPADRRALRRLLAARQPRLRQWLTAWADELLARDTLQAELDEDCELLRQELAALPGLSEASARAAAKSFCQALDRALVAGIVVD